MTLFHIIAIPEDTEIPKKCNNPFGINHADLTKKVVASFMDELEISDLGHDFGLEESGGLGKMFGVLVGKNKSGTLGYLKAFSGKLESGTNIPGFVPPVFDTFEPGGLYKTKEEEINIINQKIRDLETSSSFKMAVEHLEEKKKAMEHQILSLKMSHTLAKEERKKHRQHLLAESAEYSKATLNKLDAESARHHFEYKDMVKKHKKLVDEAQKAVDRLFSEINELKAERKKKSGLLQLELFGQYSFLNFEGKTKNLATIFSVDETQPPPSGAGECTAPKLLQYAIQHDITPIGIAEFWWGKSPASEIRLHKHFYPACRSKCHPILQHMLCGLDVEDSALVYTENENEGLEILFEDEWLVIIHKPANFLSVPGKSITDSVLTRLKKKYPEATGPLLAHRLDMSTSGILLAAKTKEVHADLQKQFQDRKITKRYVAILDGIPGSESGKIDLPLRVDLEDRPRQLVCHEHGKPSLTHFKVIKKSIDECRIHFFPVTGRTHQLRVHAAHPEGLGISIKGDDLYGLPNDRLYLHAEQITFTHPQTGKTKTITCKAPF